MLDPISLILETRW